MELQICESKKTKRKFHSSLRIDMTPMVDLGFLLITFFIFTTTMTQKTMMKLFMPANKSSDPPSVGKSKVLTVLLGKNNRIFAYEGSFQDALKENRIFQTNYNEFSGIGKLIREKQKKLSRTDGKNGKDDLVFLIKPTEQSSYKNVIDALDEATINGVKKYMIIDASPEEKSELGKIRY